MIINLLLHIVQNNRIFPVFTTTGNEHLFRSSNLRFDISLRRFSEQNAYDSSIVFIGLNVTCNTNIFMRLFQTKVFCTASLNRYVGEIRDEIDPWLQTDKIFNRYGKYFCFINLFKPDFDIPCSIKKPQGTFL